MKNQIRTLSLIATLAVAAFMIFGSGTLHAQNTPTTPSDQQAPPQQQQPSPDMPPDHQQPSTQPSPSTPQPPSAQPPATGSQSSASSTPSASGAQEFSGTVVKSGDKYVLKDDSGKTYDIDHQTDVAKFEGKRVRVQGTLDESGKKILVK